MADPTYASKPPASTEDTARPRVPPGQHLTTAFPVLTYGPTPKVDLATWRLKLWGAIDREHELTWEQFQALPQTALTVDMHCVTTWSQFDMRWEGVRFTDLLAALGIAPAPECTHVLQHGHGGYSTNNPLAVMQDNDVLLVHRWNGRPLTPEHGWPLRIVIPKRYAWKGAKWLTGIEFLTGDQRGFWETHGYHNNADPWTEQRYSHQE